MFWDQATILDKGFSNGLAWVAVRYGDSSTGQTFDEAIQDRAPSGTWPEPQIHARLDQLNAFAIDGIKVGPVGPKPVPVTPSPPSQDQIAAANFKTLFADWQAKDAALTSGASKVVTQADVDAAYAAWKAVYKEEYAPFLVGKV